MPWLAVLPLAPVKINKQRWGETQDKSLGFRPNINYKHRIKKTHTCRLCSCCWIFTWAALLSALAADQTQNLKRICIIWQNRSWSVLWRFSTCAQPWRSARLYSHCLLSAFCIRNFSRSCGVILGCRWHKCVSTTVQSPAKVWVVCMCMCLRGRSKIPYCYANLILSPLCTLAGGDKRSRDKLITSDVCRVSRPTGWAGCVCEQSQNAAVAQFRSRQCPVTSTRTQCIVIYTRDNWERERERVIMWNKSKFRSGKFGKSQWRFVTDTPIAGLLKPGQARKTAGHYTAGKFSTEADYKFHLNCLFDCWREFKPFLLWQEIRREEKSGQDSKRFKGSYKNKQFNLFFSLKTIISTF